MLYRYSVWHKDKPDVKLNHRIRARVVRTAHRRLVGTIRTVMKREQCQLDDVHYELYVLKRSPDQWAIIARHSA